MSKVSNCFGAFRPKTVCKAYQMFAMKNNLIVVKEAGKKRWLFDNILATHLTH